MVALVCTSIVHIASQGFDQKPAESSFCEDGWIRVDPLRDFTLRIGFSPIPGVYDDRMVNQHDANGHRTKRIAAITVFDDVVEHFAQHDLQAVLIQSRIDALQLSDDVSKNDPRCVAQSGQTQFNQQC